jgi:hypothetical protein
MPITESFFGTAREAFISQLAHSEHALPVPDFLGYAGEVYDMISASNMEEDICRHQKFITFPPDDLNPWSEWDAMDMSARLPARFRRSRRNHVWHSQMAKEAIKRRQVKQ